MAVEAKIYSSAIAVGKTRAFQNDNTGRAFHTNHVFTVKIFPNGPRPHQTHTPAHSSLPPSPSRTRLSHTASAGSQPP